MIDPAEPNPKSSSCRQAEYLDLWQPGRVHLIGIAGSGMRSLAHILLDIGWTVTGSDSAAAGLDELLHRGADVHHGHQAENLLHGTELVVFSDAIAADNPELQRAGQWEIPTLRYFQALGMLSTARDTTAIAGTHGKSTVAAMLGAVLHGAGADPTLSYGAEPLQQDRASTARSRAGWGRAMVVEACEYRANFLHFHPRQAVLLGIEPDHFDCYPTTDDLEHAFSLFCRSVSPQGRLLVRHECHRGRRVAEATDCRVETFGLARQAVWQAVDIDQQHGGYRFTVCYAGQDLCRIDLRVLGAHQVLNALAAAATVLHAGIAPEQVAVELSQWGGLKRRLEVVGSADGVTWIDDYAHHPTEIAAALAAIRERFPGRRVFCLYQPHQASRTARLLDETAASLQNADCVLVTEIFRAREPAPSAGEVTAADLARITRHLGAEVPPIHQRRTCGEYLSAHLRAGDVVATLGAGNIRETGHELFDRLRENRAAG